MAANNESYQRSVYYWVMFCEMCGAQMKKSRQHAFLCSARCRKKFSRLPEEVRKAIKDQVQIRPNYQTKPLRKRAKAKKKRPANDDRFVTLFGD